MLSVRPPEYFPRPEYFALVDAASEFVMADTFQYSRQSFQNRTRLRTPDGWQWISVPLMGGQHGISINRARIRPTPAWLRKHWRSLHYNYGTAPYFDFYEPELKRIFEHEWHMLGDLTCYSIEVLCLILGISTPLTRASSLPERPGDVRGVAGAFAEETLLALSDTAQHDAQSALSVRVLDLALAEYRQNFEGFRSGMSVLDLLFNYGPETMPMIRRSVVIGEPASSG